MAHSILPSVPTDGQIFVDSELVRWIYRANDEVWIRAGTVDTIPLASDQVQGLLSSTDKRLLDSTPEHPGAFGIVISPQLLGQGNPEGVIQGDIKLKSESLDISCVDGDLQRISCDKSEYTCETAIPGNTAGLMFTLSDKFLNTLVIELPGPAGETGDEGDKGPPGDAGFSAGPIGDKGPPGDSVDSTRLLSAIKFEELSGTTDTALVDFAVVPAGCKLSLTKSKIIPNDTSTADGITATALGRAVVYSEDPDVDGCDLSRLDDWTLTKPVGDTVSLDLQLVRISKGSNTGDDAVSFNMLPLTAFIADVVAFYKSELQKLHVQWIKQSKAYIESIDDKARGILSGLANQLSQCEFRLPATEYCITFTDDPATPFDTPVEEPSVPQSAPPPTPPPTPPPPPVSI